MNVIFSDPVESQYYYESANVAIELVDNLNTMFHLFKGNTDIVLNNKASYNKIAQSELYKLDDPLKVYNLAVVYHDNMPSQKYSFVKGKLSLCTGIDDTTTIQLSDFTMCLNVAFVLLYDVHDKKFSFLPFIINKHSFPILYETWDHSSMKDANEYERENFERFVTEYNFYTSLYSNHVRGGRILYVIEGYSKK